MDTTKLPPYPSFPVKVKVSANALDSFAQSEYGRYEDAVEARKRGEGHLYPARTVPEIIARSGKRTVLYIYCPDDLAEVYYALLSGTFADPSAESSSPIAAYNLERTLRTFVLRYIVNARLGKPSPAWEWSRVNLWLPPAVRAHADAYVALTQPLS